MPASIGFNWGFTMKPSDLLMKAPILLVRLPLYRRLREEKASALDRTDRQFLSRNLEILDSPPSPMGRMTAVVICCFCAIALAWAIIGKVDIVVVGRGRIISSGYTKSIQSTEQAVVKEILVHDGEHARAGDPLILLDDGIAVADRDRLSQELKIEAINHWRIESLMAESGMGAPAVKECPDTDDKMCVRTLRLVKAQAAEQSAHISDLENQAMEKQAESEETEATINRTSAQVPLLEQEFMVRKGALQAEFGNKIAFLESQERLVDQENALPVLRRHLDETVKTESSLREQLRQAKAAFERQLLTELADSEGRANEFQQEYFKIDKRIQLLRLTAPVDGIVANLSVHTVGGVVSPGEQLLSVVPTGEILSVEARIDNKDAGFIEPGQPVEIKIDAFNFTKYGLIHGSLVNISRDSIGFTLQTEQSESLVAAANKSDKDSQDKGEGIFLAKVALNSSSVQTERGVVPLGPGLAVSTEIGTGQRSVIEYILSPILRYRSEALRER